MGRTTRTRTRPPLNPTGTSQTEKIVALSKRQLEIRLSKLAMIEDPKLSLEQYPISAVAASELLYIAGFEHDDIIDKQVLDLGTGTGRLAIGAALLGARRVVGVDIDPTSIKLAQENAAKTQVNVEWRLQSIETLEDKFDTVIMNPPYGTRKQHVDTDFLKKAFSAAPTIYSIHKSSTRRFLTKFVLLSGRRVDLVRSVIMEIPHLFSFHQKKWKKIEVDIYRIVVPDVSVKGKVERYV